jgi:agmatine deiminase
MPGEFAPHERTVICWPSRHDLYGDHIGDARLAHAALAKTISGFEPVTMIANAQDAERARLLCGDAVDVVELPLDDSWFRDTGPIYVFEGDKRIAGNWVFNGWGNKFVPFDKDAALARSFAELMGHEVRNIDMVFEGGSITVDGTGLLATTEQCLLNPNRNPHMSREHIAATMKHELGATEVMWLPHGLSLDAENFDVTIREVPVLPRIDVHGVTVQVPYLNFYLVNGAVIVPVCGHAADDDMLALIAEFVPDRQVVGLDIGAILAFGGGGIHCITQQIPAL